MGLLKRLKCKHEYTVIDEVTRDYINPEINRIERAYYYILYCPYCDKTKKMNQRRYNLEVKKKKIKKRLDLL